MLHPCNEIKDIKTFLFMKTMHSIDVTGHFRVQKIWVSEKKFCINGLEPELFVADSRFYSYATEAEEWSLFFFSFSKE